MMAAVVLGAAAALWAVPAVAGPNEDNQACSKESGDRAIAACNRAIASGRFSGHALAIIYDNRGVEYYNKQDWDRAISDFTMTIKLDPKYHEGWGDRGVTYYKKNDNESALKDFDQAIRLDPKYVKALYNRGVLYQGQKDYDRAISDYTRALDADPQHSSSWYNRCLSRMIAERDLPQALGDCDQALRLNGKEAGRYDVRGAVYIKLKRHDDAIADFDKALDIAPQRAFSLYGRGIARRNKGDTAGAETDMASAKAIEPDIADSYAGYGIR
jgi:tetratricopeptide (TPR) repeat protein